MKLIKLSISIFMAMMIMAIVIPSQAQDKGKMGKERQEMGKKIKVAKIAFISEQLELTPEEAEKFWPVYNENEEKRENLTRGMMEKFRTHDEDVDMSDEKAEELMQQRFQQEEALLDLKKEYHDKYLEILPATKVLKLYMVENNFKRHLMEKMGRRGEGGEGKGESGSRGGGEGKPYHGKPMCK